MHQEPMLHNKRSHHREKPVLESKEEPSLSKTRESPRAATKTQCNQNNNNNFLRLKKKKQNKNQRGVSWRLLAI